MSSVEINKEEYKEVLELRISKLETKLSKVREKYLKDTETLKAEISEAKSVKRREFPSTRGRKPKINQ